MAGGISPKEFNKLLDRLGSIANTLVATCNKISGAGTGTVGSVEDSEYFSARLISNPSESFIVRSVSDGSTTTYTRLDTGNSISISSIEPIVQDWELKEFCFVDDVAGDGTGDLINYKKIFAVYEDPSRPMVLLKTLDEKGVDYPTIQGVERTPLEIGSDGRTGIRHFVLQNGFWAPAANVSYFSYVAISIETESVSAASSSSSFTDYNNDKSPIFDGEVGDYSLIDGTESFDVQNVRIDAGVNDIIKIQYLELTT